jgi:carboxyl-terminal processing protease
MKRVARTALTVLKIVGVIVLMAVMFIGGFSYQDIREGMRQPDTLSTILSLIPERLQLSLRNAAYGDTNVATSPLEVYADTLETVRSEYYGKVGTTRDLTYSAIRGMMGALGDRYTRFLPPDDYAKMQEDNEGQFVGIGAQLDQNDKNHQVYVVKPLPDSPALHAHVQSGDVILKVNGKSVLGLDITKVVSLIRGEPHTPVTLTLLRSGETKPITVTIVRDYVQQEVVVSEMIDPAHKIGYIALAQFNEESDPQIDQALTSLQKQGMRALVFDLRGNPGGLLDAARDIASRFVTSGPIVWVKERGGIMQSLTVEPKQHDHPRYPLAVLVNDGSASASEITSGAIKDTHSGVLIGEKTFGKGLVQTIIPLPDKSAVAITTAHYYTPLKNDINRKGIMPDIPIELGRQDQINMNNYLIAHPADTIDLKYDTQLQKAVSNLVGRLQAGEHAKSWSE